MDEHAPIPNRVEQWPVFSPPFEGGAGGGESTISTNLTLIDALFLSDQQKSIDHGHGQQ
jgi:hypothetical protein